jgi:hypothetical protein
VKHSRCSQTNGYSRINSLLYKRTSTTSPSFRWYSNVEQERRYVSSMHHYQQEPRIFQNVPFLRLLATTSPAQRRALLNTASREQIDSICECAYNIAQQNFIPSGQDSFRLGPYKVVVFKLASRKIPYSEKKRLLVRLSGDTKGKTSSKQRARVPEQRGGFLQALIAPVIGAIAGAVADRVIR